MDLLQTVNPVLTPGQRLLSTDSGFEGAEKYPFPRDCEAAIFDTRDDYVYIKKTDVNGATVLRMFHLEEVEIPRFDPKKYATVDDLKSLREDMINGFNNIQQSINNLNSNNRNPQQGGNRNGGKQNSGVSESSGGVQ